MATTDNTTALTIATETAVSTASALHIGSHFSSSAQRGESLGQLRRATWLTGNNDCFAANGKTPLPPARGFFIDMPDGEAGLYPDDYELMDAMEALCERNQAAPCVVVHRDKAGKPNKVPSWVFPVVSLFIICQGIPQKAAMQRDPELRWGAAYGWTPDGKSELHIQFFIKELMEVGYSSPFVAKFGGRCTDKALACLFSQHYVLNFADSLRGDEEPLPYYAYALPIQCSARTLTAGQGEKTTEIYYPVPAVPRLSKRNQQESLAYLAANAITVDQALALEYDGRVERVIEWSVAKSRRITSGDVDEAGAEGGSMVELTDTPF